MFTKKRSAAFTLVELLIVIIVIGILVGSMMLVLASGNHAAEAAKIISDLRSLKTATVLYYLDHPEGPEPTIDHDLKALMDRPPDGRYDIDKFSTDYLYAYCDLTDVSSGIIEKLKNNDSAIEVMSGDTIARIRIL
jgi:general secretion pathway protein G